LRVSCGMVVSFVWDIVESSGGRAGLPVLRHELRSRETAFVLAMH
jgi:hypothetical protein